MIAEYYLLRIYRRGDGDKEEVLGTLEQTASGISWSFRGDEELYQLVEQVTHSFGGAPFPKGGTTPH